MSTVFADELFIKSELYTTDKKNKIICTIRDSSNRFLTGLLRQESKGLAVGRLVEPFKIPDWLVPGTVLFGEVQSIKAIFTYEGVIQSRIQGLSEILGDKLKFSYITVVEFND